MQKYKNNPSVFNVKKSCTVLGELQAAISCHHFLAVSPNKSFSELFSNLITSATDIPLTSCSQSCLEKNGMQMRKTQVDVQKKDIARSHF